MSWNSECNPGKKWRELGAKRNSLDTAVDHDAKGAPGYLALHHLIRGGCKAAIWVSERV